MEPIDGKLKETSVFSPYYGYKTTICYGKAFPTSPYRSMGIRVSRLRACAVPAVLR